MNNQYHTVIAWETYMGAYDYYRQAQVEKAKRMNAPADALYERDGVWTRMADLAPDHDFRAYFARMFPEG